jgi:predicted amidohydrolase YtcJ
VGLESQPLLIEARLLTMEALTSAPTPGAVACAEGRIVAVGTVDDCERALSVGYRRIVAPEATLIPGFIDAHVHVLAAAAAEAGSDISPQTVSTIPELLEVVREVALSVAPGAWVRAYGFEETMLAEGRAPTRDELDAVSLDRPVRLLQRSGHAEVFNSSGLALLGLDESVSEPRGAIFGRFLDDGRLNGMLVGMKDVIEAAMPPHDFENVKAHVHSWTEKQASYGVTTFVDAGARNGIAEWGTFERLLREGALSQRIVVMEAVSALGELPANGVGGQLLRGESKLQPNIFQGETVEVSELVAQIAAVHAAGRRIAIHAPTEQAVESSLEAFRQIGSPSGQRLEHAPLLTPKLIDEISSVGAVVVAQPGLLVEVTPRYEQLLDHEDRKWLQPWRTVLDAGVLLASSSDAPVSRTSALGSIAAASSQRPHSLTPGQAITPIEALHTWTAGAADVTGLSDCGRLRVGQIADLVLVDGFIETDLSEAQVSMTVRAGEIVYEVLGD